MSRRTLSRLKISYFLLFLFTSTPEAVTGAGLTVSPHPPHIISSVGDVVTLRCTSSIAPSICLWKTPYQAIYSVGGGRVWEDGRLSSTSEDDGQCGLVISGLQARDEGVWQCEVGAVTSGEFSTTTADTSISIVRRDAGVAQDSKLIGLEGKEILIPCAVGASASSNCRWQPPYGGWYDLAPGDYAERGRLQVDNACGLRVSSLQERDSGGWTCQVTTTTDSILETQTQLHIETPLKLSAPTSILQQADERATLVCHANKRYETCQWETPYGRTVQFDQGNRQAESGRLQYFGFSDMDCGIVIKDIGVRDSGGWTCRVTARVAGKPQISADIVRLFVEPTQYEYPQEDQKIIQSSPPDYTIDYAALDYNQDESKMDDYDAFDYVNGDFDKVRNGGARTEGSSKKKRPQTSVHNGGGSTSRPSNNRETTVETLHRIEEDDGFIRETQIFGKFGTVRIDKIPGQIPREETSTVPVPTVPSVSSERPVQPIFHPEDEMLEDHTVKSKINPSELDFLALISSSRVKDRPFNIKNNTDEFGSRQPGSAGNGFQFGNVQIVGEGKQDDRTSLAVPRAIEANNQEKDENRRTTEERRKQQADEDRERMERIRKQREEAEKRRLLEIKNKEAAEKRRQDELRQKEEDEKKRIEEIERKKKEEKEEEDRRRKERIEKLKKEREEQLKKEQQEKDKKEREKQLREQREKRRREEREKRLKEERERKRKEEMEERERKRQEEIEQRKRQEQEKKLRDERRRKQEEEKAKKEQEERQRKINEERERRLKEEEERQKKIQEERQKRLREEEERQKKLKEERERQLREEREKRRKEEIAQKRKEEKERKIKEERKRQQEKEQAKLEEEIKRKVEEEKRLEQIKVEEEQLRLKKLEERRNQERERIRNELLEQKRKQEDEERLKRIQDEKQRKIDLERERKRQEEVRRIQEENEKFEKEQEEKEKQLQLERERIKQEEIETQRKEYEEMKRREEEEAKLRKLQQEREEKERIEQEKIKQEELERKKKEEEEIARIRKQVEERRREIMRLREEQAAKDKILEEEREKARKEKEEETRLREQEIEMIRQRDKERKKELEKLRELQAERERLLREEREKVRKENDLKRQQEEEENDKLRQQAIARKMEIEELRALQLERETQLKAERERIRQQKLELEKQQMELQRQRELLDKIRQKQEEPRFTAASDDDNGDDNSSSLRKCLINPHPEGGNITCPGSPIARGKFIVTSGNSCQLTCHKDFISLDSKEAKCYNGRLTQELYCVLPGAMIVVGGRSDGSGVLSSVELLTSGGVCHNLIPDIPSMRWKMISASITKDLVVACGGTNFLGDPKTDCWKMEFVEYSKHPRWTPIGSLSVPRDAAAWAAEEGKLYVMGGSLGTLAGYTASTEVYHPDRDIWEVGVSLTSTRASHCAVGDSRGHIIVTGGYGALELVQSLDLVTGKWRRLADLQPVRAQHGCALVEHGGRRGVVVVGGDSGGTRLSDVRFLALDSEDNEQWLKIADLNTARWGRPSVGVVGGRMTVIGGWDGVKTLNSVETYDEENERWETQRRIKLSVDRRWAAGTQISHSLFPQCIRRRS